MYDCIILGGSGFIGSKLVKSLINQNKKILNLDIVEPNFKSNFSICDITDIQSLSNAFEPAKTLILLSAAHADDCDIQDYYSVNHLGTKNTIAVANKFNIKEIIFISSVAVYGDNQDIDSKNLTPNHHYGKSKLMAENELLIWQKKDINNRKLKIIRPTAVFGFGSKGNTNRFFLNVIKNRFFFVGNKNTIKSICFVDNLVDFIIFSLTINFNFTSNYVDKPDLKLADTTKLINNSKSKKNFFDLTVINFPFFLFITIYNLLNFIGFINLFIKDLNRERIMRIRKSTTFKGTLPSLNFSPKISLNFAIANEVKKYEKI